MVRELNTDGPGGGPSVIVPVATGARPLVCSARAFPGALQVPDAHALLEGRKGNYLVFYIAAAAGAQRIEVTDAKTARVLYTDGIAPIDGAWKLVALDGTSLHLRFTRQVDAPCSLVRNAIACWQALLRARVISPVLGGAPAASICADAYRAAQAPPDDQSEVLYDVDMILDAAGSTRVLSRGTVRCEPAS